MKFPFKGFYLSYEQIVNNYKNTKAILFLHGFTGSSKDWEETAKKILKNFNIYTIDLIGHGKSNSPDDVQFYTTESIIEQIYELVKTFKEKNIFLLGYSMGGRAALNFAIKYQDMLTGLILESTSAGIVEKSEREKRTLSDNHLAGFIKSHSIEEFVDYWMDIELFKTQKDLPKKIFEKVREEKLKNNKIGLANSLIGFGAGKVNPLYDSLKNISIKTLLFSGELDKKYTEINSKLSKDLLNAQHLIIKNAGHNTHLENPADFTSELNKFLSGF
jgi:2-succinyl-6-hydroxy-2,4-cyclohexadiene-1-carboxylate synthase